MNVNEINDPILDWVEERGGGYVWDAEVFAVTLLETCFDDADAAQLSRLVGVQQIAVDAREMSMVGLMKLASIPGIASVVIRNGRLEPEEIARLKETCPEVLMID